MIFNKWILVFYIRCFLVFFCKIINFNKLCFSFYVWDLDVLSIKFLSDEIYYCLFVYIIKIIFDSVIFKIWNLYYIFGCMFGLMLVVEYELWILNVLYVFYNFW